MTNEVEAFAKETAKLIGWKITEVFLDEAREYYGFQVEKNGVKKDVWVNRDPEANGPGFLNIE